MATNDEGTSARFYFDVSGSYNQIHVGDVTNHIYPETNREQQQQQQQQQAVYAKKVFSHLRNCHAEQNRLIQCLPGDEDELFPIEDYYSPVFIQDVKNQQVELSDIIKDERKIHIAGDAGSGKSTLIKKMCYDWGMNVNSYLKEFRLVFNIPLRSVGEKTIQKFVFNLIEVDEFDENCARKLLNEYEEETLFFLDGLDEIANVGPMLAAIFQSYPDATFVITSRFAWDQKILLKQKFKRCLRLDGFTDEGVEIFRGKYFRNIPNSRLYVEKLIKSDDACAKKCIENFKCPLFLHLFCYCFKFSQRKEPLKVTQLYEEMFDILRQKSEERHQVSISKDDLNSSLISFGKIALKALKDSILLDQDDVVDQLVIKLGFLREDSILNSNNRIEKKFQPIHQTFLEFLAAFYMKHLLLTNLSEFEEIIASLPERLINSKRSATGSGISLFIIFLCGLLGENAYLFFRVMDSKMCGRFKSMEKFSLLVWHAGDGELSKNIEYLSQSQRLQHTCLYDFFKKSYDNFSNITWNIISNSLKHPECRLNKLHLDEGSLNKFEKFAKLVVKTLSENKSITELELIKDGRGSFAKDVYEGVLSRSFGYFIEIVNSMPLLTTISVNQDIFIDKISVHDEFFAKFMAAIKKHRLVKLSISTTPVLSDVCDSFIDGNNANVSNTNASLPSKKDRKKIRPTLTDEHFKLFVQNCHLGLDELHLSRLRIAADTAKNLSPNRFLGLRVLKLPFLKCGTDLGFIFRLLSEESCRLEHLDLSKYEFESDEEVARLFDAVKTNKSLKYLNLAQAQTHKDENALRCLCDCLTHNQTLGHLHVSFDNFTVNEKGMEEFLNACLSSRSRLKELHLSGWTFEITKLQMFVDIAKMATEFSSLEKICLKGVKLDFHSDYDFDVDLVVSFFNNLINCPQLQLVDGRECVFRYELEERPEVGRSDSGYNSSFDSFELPAFEAPAPIVRKPKEIQFSEIRDQLKCNQSVKIICSNQEWNDYRYGQKPSLQ